MRKFVMGKMCQCPISGALHFYVKKDMKEAHAFVCQCPISGALHFYAETEHPEWTESVCVNALSRAHFISTTWHTRVKYSNWFSVNALSRAHFISTNEKQKKGGTKMKDVSMPYLGRTSFLRVKSYTTKSQCVVSMPYLGRTSFLQHEQLKM